MGAGVEKCLVQNPFISGRAGREAGRVPPRPVHSSELTAGGYQPGAELGAGTAAAATQAGGSLSMQPRDLIVGNYTAATHMQIMHAEFPF